MEPHGILQMQDTDDMINILLIHRITAVLASQHGSNGIFQFRLTINGHDTSTMCHDILGFLISVFENVGDHLRLTGLNDTLLMTFLHHIDDLFLGHIIFIRIVADTEEEQDSLGCQIHQPRQGCQQSGDNINRVNTGIRPLLRLSGCHFPGNQHTESQQDIDHGNKRQYRGNP